MAKFSFNGMDELELSLEQLAAMPDDVKWSVLSAGAEVVKAAHQAMIRRLFKQHTGSLLNSISVRRKNSKSGNIVASISPTGKHPGSKSKKHAGTNAEVAFYLEYGTPRIKATHWMEKANEDEGTQEAIIEAEQSAYNEWLDSLGL